VFPAWTGLAEYVTDLIGRFHYLAPFTILFLCGLGFPLPEEVALVGAGILLYQGKVEFAAITVVCSIAILLGDAVPYWLGRQWGIAALKSPWMAKILHPERFTKLERRFAEHGNWVIFSCRFMPGLRIPAYFVAGTLRMGFPRFMLLDVLGVAISVPASIWLGKFFGDSIQQLTHKFKELNLILGFVVFALVVVIVWRSWWRRRERESNPSGGAPGGTVDGASGGSSESNPML
jgi:membrane protein DedA with SNARE-associated domain